MKTNILVPGIMAVAIHALILSAPLSETRYNGARAHVYEPLSICVICPQERVAALPRVQASGQVPETPRFEDGSHVPGRHTAILKKKAGSKKRLAVKSVTARNSTAVEARKLELAANPDNQHRSVEERSPEQMRKVREKMIDGSHSIKTASINGHIRGSGQRHMGVPQEGQSGQGGIVYARPKYKENPLPHYPKVARRRGYQGRTLLMVKVLENGRAGEIEIKESSGFKMLDTAALHSVRGWTFVPGTINGKKTQQWIGVPIRFVLK